MTITPTPEQERILVKAMEAGLIERAEDALNVGLETLRSKLPEIGRRLTPAEWLEEFDAWANSHSTSTPLLSDEAVSREFIYRERGL